MRKSVWIFSSAVGGGVLLFGALHASNPDGRSKQHPLGDFHRWTKLNGAPAALDRYVMELCRSPTELEQHQMEVDPHTDYMHQAHMNDDMQTNYVNVYVNRRGVKEMLSGAALPVGSVIVKEKLATPAGPPLECTAMIKRSPATTRSAATGNLTRWMPQAPRSRLPETTRTA